MHSRKENEQSMMQNQEHCKALQKNKVNCMIYQIVQHVCVNGSTKHNMEQLKFLRIAFQLMKRNLTKEKNITFKAVLE